MLLRLSFGQIGATKILCRQIIGVPGEAGLPEIFSRLAHHGQSCPNKTTPRRKLESVGRNPLLVLPERAPMSIDNDKDTDKDNIRISQSAAGQKEGTVFEMYYGRKAVPPITLSPSPGTRGKSFECPNH